MRAFCPSVTLCLNRPVSVRHKIKIGFVHHLPPNALCTFFFFRVRMDDVESTTSFVLFIGVSLSVTVSIFLSTFLFLSLVVAVGRWRWRSCHGCRQKRFDALVSSFLTSSYRAELLSNAFRCWLVFHPRHEESRFVPRSAQRIFGTASQD